MKVHLLVLENNNNCSIYYVYNSERFLILLEEYLQKLLKFQENPTKVSKSSDPLNSFSAVHEISPIEDFFEFRGKNEANFLII